MTYKLFIGGSDFDVVDPSIMEKVIGDRSELDYAAIEFVLPFTIHGVVRRDYKVSLDDEEVILRFNKKERKVRRNTLDEYEDGMFVTCKGYGKEVLVESFDLKFRPESDSFVSGKMVHVIPGNPAKARIELYPKAFNRRCDSFEKIIADAKTAIQTQLINRIVD